MESNEKIIREAYRLAEGDVRDGDAFLALFTEDGSFNDMSTSQSFRGEQIPQAIAGLARSFPDVHRELLAVHAFGDVVAVELRIQGTHLGGFPTPAGEIPPTGNRIDVPAADFWYLRDGKIEKFVCYNLLSVWLDQIGVHPDFKSAVEAGEAAVTTA
ncbi:nuclear transport factor 2 family protein [Actinospica acidiphila]|uniref:Nuclear transport factor 2 family protein n=1 Tax=Actinospica acidiphila TaxID=304899 RepID=A0A9X5CJ71_9ACTN|nr:nuclear transport factor 2 family protein [Actinospica acidiphila]NEC49525.1 nuclear transport factor 2 family protein [Actinospica acidiphila]